MYSNFTKFHALPIAIRASSHPPKHFLQSYIKSKNPKFLPSSRVLSFRNSSIGLIEKLGSANRDKNCLVSFNQNPRNFSTSYARKAVESSESAKTLPWLAKNGDKEKEFEHLGETRFTKSGREKVRRKDFKEKRESSGNDLESKKAVRSSWEESAKKFVKNGGENGERNDYRERRKVSEDESTARKVNQSSWEKSAEKYVKIGGENGERNDYREKRKVSEDELIARKVNRSSWEESAEKFVKNGVENRGRGRRFDERNDQKYVKNSVEVGERGRRFDERNDYRERRKISEDESDIESEETDKPNWYKVQERFDRFDNNNDVARNGNEFRKWNRQDNFGKKVWKEATESSVPSMVGECVYGVGPVLAALSANRREFYVLYVQEGIDLSGNNKKKKDKKGFEKVLKFAQKIGLTVKEITKHDLNMIVDSRPHQGLVLDASPLEMVNIQKLDHIIPDKKDVSSPLWLALDEVMDPQNLGAIIRSAYFFGASGVVLCAKNSAPLSGVVSKASAGSLELTELRSCKNMMQFLVSSAENGWRVLGGSVSSRAVGLDEVVTGQPTILVLGSEGTGLRPLVERSCTQLVRIQGNIPVHVGVGVEDMETAEFGSFLAVESLNVSVAAGVLLHHLVGINNKKSALDANMCNSIIE